jgi:thermitase
MPHPSSSLSRCLALALPLLLALLGTGCGGGGGASQPSAPASVLLEASPSDIDDVAEDTGATVLRQIPGTEVYEVEVPPGQTLPQFLALLDDDVRVVEAEPDAELDNPEGGASTIPAGTTELAASISVQPELLRIGLAQALARARGAGVLVAVVDTGVEETHPFLAGSFEPGGYDVVDRDADAGEERNFLDDDRDGLVDEGFGHGTFVASLIHAVAPDARLLAFRVLASDGVGSASWLAEGITRAADAGAQVINVSIGMHQQSHVVKRAVEYARSRGAVVVGSAGNTGVESVAFPSALSDAFAVSAVGPTDVRATFASFGSGVDLSAPGVDLLGAHPGFPSGTARWSGTSFAAALASGACALVRSLAPDLEPDALQQALEDASADIDAQNPTLGGRLGRGRLDLDLATAP